MESEDTLRTIQKRVTANSWEDLAKVTSKSYNGTASQGNFSWLMGTHQQSVTSLRVKSKVRKSVIYDVVPAGSNG
jgi:hypothetical protein